MMRLQDVDYHYPNNPLPVLCNINLDIVPGKALGLLGPNGAGKTTLMLLMSGLLPTQSGQILWQNQSLVDLPKSERQKIAMVPQDLAFYPQLTVWENLRFFASLYPNVATHHLHSLLNRLDLSGKIHARAHRLSGGQKRRLNLAIGLVNSPKLIFLDEVTVGVDPQSRTLIFDLINDLTSRGTTLIYTSHYLQEIELLCQDIAILNQGNLAFHGSVHDVLQDTNRASCVIQTEPRLNTAQIATLPTATLRADGSLVFGPEIPLAEILRAIHDCGATIRFIRKGHNTLESFYLDFLRQTAA